MIFYAVEPPPDPPNRNSAPGGPYFHQSSLSIQYRVRREAGVTMPPLKPLAESYGHIQNALLPFASVKFRGSAPVLRQGELST